MNKSDKQSNNGDDYAAVIFNMILAGLIVWGLFSLLLSKSKNARDLHHYGTVDVPHKKENWYDLYSNEDIPAKNESFWGNNEQYDDPKWGNPRIKLMYFPETAEHHCNWIVRYQPEKGLSYYEVKPEDCTPPIDKLPTDRNKDWYDLY